MPPFAAIFDWDGVIIDSEECHRIGWERLARETARTLPPDYCEKSFGRRDAEIVPEILGWTERLDELDINNFTDRNLCKS